METETKERFSPAPESTTDWEDGIADIPAGRLDYSRTSHPYALEEGPEAEANSDIGNLGRDVEEERDVVRSA